MKKIICMLVLALLLGLCSGCAGESADVAATTLPTAQFAQRICDGTGLTVVRLITENVSCLHDYTLQVSQMQAVEAAEVVILSGAGLEEFMEEPLERANRIIDSAQGVALLPGEEHESHEHGHGDPHIWLSPANAKLMARNIRDGLWEAFPEHRDTFDRNLAVLLEELDELENYGRRTLSQLKTQELVTFHDGFSYFAQSFGLTILAAVEEESGSEPSAREIIELVGLVREHQLPAIFTETNGGTAAAKIIAAETGAKVCTLDMAMAGDDYFTLMYHNIDTIKEALG